MNPNARGQPKRGSRPERSQKGRNKDLDAGLRLIQGDPHRCYHLPQPIQCPSPSRTHSGTACKCPGRRELPTNAPSRHNADTGRLWPAAPALLPGFPAAFHVGSCCVSLGRFAACSSEYKAGPHASKSDVCLKLPIERPEKFQVRTDSTPGLVEGGRRARALAASVASE